MALNPNIPLQVQGIDTATPLRQLGADLQQNQAMAQQKELMDLQIVGQRYANLDNREKARINSVTMMAAELQPLLESGDSKAAVQKLKQRRKNLQAQIADGLPVDTMETDRLIGMLEAGDLDQAKNSMSGQIKLGQMLGLLEEPQDTRLQELQIRQAELGIQKTQKELNEQPQPKLPDGTKIPEGYKPVFENGQFVRVEPIEGIEPGSSLNDVDRNKIEKDLRGEYTDLNKDFVKVRDAYAKITSTDETAAGDIGLVINYMKILDPGSVVREGEFATAQNAAGVPGRVRAAYNGLLEGTRLTPEQRADFKMQAGNLYKAQLQSYDQNASTYKGLAERAGVDVDDVVIDFTLQEKPDPLGIR